MKTQATDCISLYRQMAEHGYTLEEIRKTTRVYELATKAFSGHFRPSGRTFISHLVGTANVLVQDQMDIDLIHAGMLHAFYSQGNESAILYASLLAPKSLRLKHLRRRMQDLLGSGVENIIYCYHSRKWNSNLANDYCENFLNISPLDKSVISVRIANEFDEFYEAKGVKCSIDYLELLIKLSTQLGMRVLAGLLSEESRLCESDQLRDFLWDLNKIKSSGRLSSYFLMPKQCMLKPGIAFVYKFRAITGYW